MAHRDHLRPAGRGAAKPIRAALNSWDRDAANVAKWFAARGLSGTQPAPEDLQAVLHQAARIG